MNIIHTPCHTQVWCAQEERQLQTLTQCSSQGKPCPTVVYVSGDKPLTALTADLLRHNAHPPQP